MYRLSCTDDHVRIILVIMYRLNDVFSCIGYHVQMIMYRLSCTYYHVQILVIMCRLPCTGYHVQIVMYR